VFAVGKLFHLAHLVDDLDAVDHFYDEVFACQRFYRRYEKAAKREASLLVISDMIMEPILPDPSPEAAGTPLRKFQDRFGNRLHSIAWYVDDITACSAHLGSCGIRQVGLTGRPITDPRDAVAVWSHPRDTHALLEFCEPGFAADPRLAEDWSADRWRDDHPLGIARTSHVTVTLEDLADAGKVYGEALLGRLLHTEEETGVARRAYYAVGEETVVCAVQPLSSTTPEGRDLAENGEQVFGITFGTVDLGRAVAFLGEKGYATTEVAPETVLVDLPAGWGLRLELTSRRIPGDAR
jgi:hypothetical protein